MSNQSSPNQEEFARRLVNLREMNSSLKTMISRFEATESSSPQLSPSSSPIGSPNTLPTDESTLPRYLAHQRQEYSQNIAKVALQSRSEITKLQDLLSQTEERLLSAERQRKEFEKQNKVLLKENVLLSETAQNHNNEVSQLKETIKKLTEKNESLVEISLQYEEHSKEMSRAFEEEKEQLILDFEQYEEKYKLHETELKEAKEEASRLEEKLNAERDAHNDTNELFSSILEAINLIGEKIGVDCDNPVEILQQCVPKLEDQPQSNNELDNYTTDLVGLVEKIPRPFSLKGLVNELELN
ncbi:hypothetical protein P9112_006800 [Eukaryota sp. TZLM1-RC]